MKKSLIVIAACFAIVGLVGCSKDVSFETLETARTQAKSNAEYNAQKFRADSPAFANFALEIQGDSTQTPACPQGDGWASGKLVNKDNLADKVLLKCSTVSGAVGCMTQKDFQTKPYASDDGKCQAVEKVPFPIPKISK